MPQPSMYSSSTSSPCEREQSSSSSSSCSSGSGSASGSVSGKRGSNQTTTNVTAFLSKLWRLVDDKAYDDMVCWSQTGCSFIIVNQTRFAKELLPLYFKHGNMASFIRQLNMYGFRKLSNNCTNGMKEREHRKISPDMAHFYHVNFTRDNERKIADIKRKSNSYKAAQHLMANGSFCEEVKAMMSDVKSIKDLQSTSESILDDMHVEKKTLWIEMDLLRARHQKQQKVVERVIQFLKLVSSADKKIKKEEDCSQRRRRYQQQQQQHQEQQHQQIVLYLDQTEQQNKANDNSNTNTFNMSPSYSIESPGSNYINGNNDYSNNVLVNQQFEQTSTNVVASATTPDLVANDASCCCCDQCFQPFPLQQHHQQQNHHQQQQQQQHHQQQQQQIQFQHQQQQHQEMQIHTDQMTTNQLSMRFQHQHLFSLDQNDLYSSSFNTSSDTNSSSADNLVATYWPTS